jgi:hypothetical protein
MLASAIPLTSLITQKIGIALLSRNKEKLDCTNTRHEFRIPENCAYTTQHASPKLAQTTGAAATVGLAIPNGGLQVVNPSRAVYDMIIAQLATPTTSTYDFADQSLLADVFHGRWVALPYIYNALKTLRWDGVHKPIWQDEKVKNVHYILSPKPWDESEDLWKENTVIEQNMDETHGWWWKLTKERRAEEKLRSVNDRF